MSRPLPDDPLVLVELRDELTVSIKLHQQVVSLASSCLRNLTLAHQAAQAGPDEPLAGLLEHFGRMAEEYSALACHEARPRADTAVRRHLLEYLSEADQAQHAGIQTRAMEVFIGGVYRLANLQSPRGVAPVDSPSGMQVLGT